MAAQWECKIFDPGTLQLCPVTFFDCLLVSLEQTNIHTDRKTSKYKHANKNPESQISFISKGEGGRQREKKKKDIQNMQTFNKSSLENKFLSYQKHGNYPETS